MSLEGAAGPQRMDLSKRLPQEGDTVVYDGQEWEVTDYSAYKNDEGYNVKEWCCETDDTEAYLLRESAGQGEYRWFFTRWIDASKVTFPGGEVIPEWTGGDPVPEPPKNLTCEGEAYGYGDTTDGTYEDEPGEECRKITWDYWDAGKRRNVAIELWDNGESDCYRGSYIRADQVELRTGTGLSFKGFGSEPVLVWLGCSGIICILGVLFAGIPCDRVLAISLAVGALISIFFTQRLAPSYYGAAALCACGLGAIFRFCPPLSHPVGMAAAAAAPWIFVLLANRGQDCQRSSVRHLAVVTAFMPAFAWGCYHYFAHAPGHTPWEYFLALRPAALAAAAAYLIVTWLVPGVREGGK